tara:strand:- start:520 stop:675 length:156 start_codon:yes stop_codon:yes gene_type:complete
MSFNTDSIELNLVEILFVGIKPKITGGSVTLGWLAGRDSRQIFIKIDHIGT